MKLMWKTLWKKWKHYENMITKDGYGIIPWAKRFVLLYNNEQLSDHKTILQATGAMNKHRKKEQDEKLKLNIKNAL